MAPAVTRQENRLRVAHPAKPQQVGRFAPGGRDSLLAQ